MLLHVRGVPNQVNELIVGKITRDPLKLGIDKIFILEDENICPGSGFSAILTTRAFGNISVSLPSISLIPALNHLDENDIVYLGLDGNVKTLFRVNSFYNTILATERCNSNCLMCSQPPKDKNDVPRLFEIYSKAIPLIPKDCFELTISGGEPTLMGDYFFQLVQQITKELPNTELHILSNGRIFAWENWASRLSDIDNSRMMIGVPVYSDYYQVHDFIVQAKNAFNQTILGLHNLARYNQRIEIRIVLHKQTIPRLLKLSKFIFKNLPFVEHVTFMGLEYTGYTPYNIEKLWIDPYDYQKELSDSIEFLARRGMNVSIYNSTLCTLPKSLWTFSKKSISDWKNDYLPVCQDCDMLDACGGLFSWNLKKHSRFIRAIKFE